MTDANPNSANRPAAKRSKIEKTYDKAAKAIEKGRKSALKTARSTADSLEANPLALLAGGIALGAVVGALVPRGEREGKLLAPVGKRITDTAGAAAKAARDAGKAELDSLGLNRATAQDQVGKLLGGVVKALATAGAAAAETAKAKE
ncbi:MAG: hypothetical protein V4564_07455 [Pseudomonadota bacterium]|uniref:hypothetical protein n=1 Tax=Sphingomonas sp. ERG5 TaxID=1381597 RepID=UPI00054B5D8D|nr:hypothetical protein [Sphingomonas sp. ERG5]